eukprot:EG_transcript_6813
MGRIFDEDINIEVVIVLAFIGFAGWSVLWWLIIRLVQKLLAAVYGRSQKGRRGKSTRRTRRRTAAGSVQPITDAGGEAGPREHLFCFECAAMRPTKLVEFLTGSQRYSTCCEACDGFLHVEDEWVIRLVTLVKNWGEKGLDINPSFPVRKYASTSEIVIYLYKTAIAIMNIVLVAYYFEYFLWAPRHPEEVSDLLVRVLVVLELAAVVAMLCRYLFLSGYLTLKRPRNKPLKVFLGVFLVFFPRMAMVNGIGSIRLWDVNAIVSLVIGTQRKRPFNSRKGKLVVTIFEGLTWLPAAVCVLLIPTVALLARLQQLRVCMVVYLSDWGAFEWVLFLRFLLDIAVLVELPAVMQDFGHHLLKEQILIVTSEVFDDLEGVRNFLATIIVFFTCGVVECYEIIKPDSAMWCLEEKELKAKSATKPSDKYLVGSPGEKSEFAEGESAAEGGLKTCKAAPMDPMVAVFSSLPPAAPPPAACVQGEPPGDGSPRQALPQEGPFFKAPMGVLTTRTSLVL